MKKSIAVIGQGFVGGSLTTVFSERGHNVYVYDKADKVAKGGYSGCSTSSSKPSVAALVKRLEQNLVDVKHKSFSDVPVPPILNFSKIYFVCLPTPMYEDGEADLSIVEGVLRELAEQPGERIAVVKSTVPPGSTELWNKMFNEMGLTVVFNPEFLREASALEDMRNQERIVLGGPRPQINQVKLLFQQAFPNVPIVKTSSTTAEMVKYFTNIQLATRVVLSCELSEVCHRLDDMGMNIDYDKVVEYAKLDPRLGGSHMNIPGPDGIAGARGHCFPKDLAALISLANKIDLNPKLMQAVWDKNLDIVKPEDRDWEKMYGRAISKRKK